MRTGIFALAALLVSGAMAGEWRKVDPQTIHALRDLRVRQNRDGSFMPGTTQGRGKTCVDAFGAGFELCADSKICYNPVQGDLCCSEGYPCPRGSFCLTKGYCCPNGLDPKECAKKNNIELPPNFKPSSGAPFPTGTSRPSGGSTGIMPTGTGSMPTGTTMNPTRTGTATATGTATRTTSGSSSSTATRAPTFTGAASQNSIQGAAAAVAALGLLNLL